MRLTMKISSYLVAATVLTCFSTACASQKEDNAQSELVSSRTTHESAYTELLEAFANYAGTETTDVHFTVRSVPVVEFVNDTEVYCNGRTSVYSFTAGNVHGMFYCASYYTIDSLDETPPHIVDGHYTYDPSTKTMVTPEGYSLPVCSPVKFDEETERRLGYTSAEIAYIINHKYTEEATFNYSY